MYVELETISSSHGVPAEVRWLVKPLTDDLPRKMMTDSNAGASCHSKREMNFSKAQSLFTFDQVLQVSTKQAQLGDQASTLLVVLCAADQQNQKRQRNHMSSLSKTGRKAINTAVKSVAN